MAKFRRHHQKSGRGPGAFTGRLILVFLLILFVIAAFFWLNKSAFFGLLESNETQIATPNYENVEDRFFLPNTKNGRIVHHRHFSLSYDEEAEQAEWVAYYLTRSSLQKPNVSRSRRFNEDKAIPSGSATYYDYRGSGYDRGHLVPAADMAFEQQAMQETFLMSNISPQIKTFNGGIWKELEESVRDWAYKYQGLYVVTGPVFGNSTKKIGQSNIRVPESFFKVLLDLESEKAKGIAFLLPNAVSYEPLSEYAITIDELENITGFNFYDQLLEDTVEGKIEALIDVDQWPLSQKRFDLRTTKWNRIR